MSSALPIAYVDARARRTTWLISWQIEYIVVNSDKENKTAHLSLRQTEILQKLQSVTLDPKLEKYKPKGWWVTHFSTHTPSPGTSTTCADWLRII